ncbi:MAG: arsenate reductase (glutaredoxin) [Proteobacteria bacterium]|nr:arsenate reductase (glutaredoxin) [Pseudomonadota bacterium]
MTSSDPSVVLYHNPGCSTSRNVLAMLRERGVEPIIVEYLKTPPGKARLRELIHAMGGSVRALLRTKAAPYEELGLADPKWTDEQLLDFMVQHPVLMERPVLVTPLGTRLGRPKEKVLEVLPG